MFIKFLIYLILINGLASCQSLEQLTDILPTTVNPNQDLEFNQQQSHLLEQQQQSNQRCDDARLKCAFRLDCGQALTSYMIHCADLIAGATNKDQCPSKCFKALIALASTEQGAKLVDCDCANSQFCNLSKERIGVCRKKVEHVISDHTVVSCSTAKFICSSNTQCLTALIYYNKFCKAMFKGKYCTKRCLNSLNILQKQKNAHKLSTCICDGTEDFPCEAIKHNTDLLCLKKANYSGTSIELLANNEDHRPKHHHLKQHRHHHKTNHKFDFEYSKLRHRNRELSADFETSPIDSEQIKKNVYFDIMMSEALSSNSRTVLSSIYKLSFIFLNAQLILNLIYRF